MLKIDNYDVTPNRNIIAIRSTVFPAIIDLFKIVRWATKEFACCHKANRGGKLVPLGLTRRRLAQKLFLTTERKIDRN